MRPALVILTTHFGTNFSGGSTATCEILSRIEDEFSVVHVVANEVGEHPFNNIVWHRYRSAFGALQLIRKLHRDKPIFYADFYNAYWLSLLRIPYFFTYHDNWPELGALSPRFRLQQFFYWPLYRWIFRTAEHVVTVSERKKRLLRRWCRQLSLVRNGCQRAPEIWHDKQRKNVLMVGNIDERKYAKAVELFNTLDNDPGFRIDIYGHPNSAELERKLSTYSFVSLRDFQSDIPYSHYRLLLHTSMMENLSIVWCEALLHRTPVLTFDIGAANEVVTNGFGVRISPYDIHAMQHELTSLVHSPITLNVTPEHLDEFSWDTAAMRYRSILLSATETPERKTCAQQSSSA